MTEPEPRAAPALHAGALVSIAELTKTFIASGGHRVVAVDSVGLDLAPASVTAVVGPSGSGKSTLLRLVGGLDRADSGVIVVDTEKVTALPARELPGYRRRIGLVFERDLLVPELTVLDNVRVLAPGRSRDAAEQASELLAAVGLSGVEGLRPDRLRPVDRQRVSIARALFNRPGLLLADEPTGALDSAAGGEIIELIVRVRDDFGVTVLLATQDPETAIHCDRVVRMQDGRVADDSAALA
ncbi:MAG TPA: ATP-binding cassette domain-containing protein [Streptosporangiaceae bacterium]|nr:ATP-binding cassette domain-containing protein [Streptosporangiaceae bacterium]